MPVTKEREKRTVTLEQLLQLKRAERPEPAFWEGFDRELRRRQLASLVTIRPWYERVGRVIMLVLRRLAPVGAAAAALAAGVVVWDMKEHPAPIVQTADVDPDSRPALLPEEHFAWPPAGESLQKVQLPVAPAARPQAHYVVQQFSTSRASSGAFMVDASPVTFSSRSARPGRKASPEGL